MPRNNSTNWSVNDQITAARIQDINEDLDDIYANWDDRGRIVLASSWTALRIDIAEFTYKVWDATGTSSWLTNYAVTNNATTYFEVDWAGTISTSTSGFDVNKAPIWRVVAAGWAITSIILNKVDIFWGDTGGGGGFRSISSTTYNNKDQLTQVVSEWVDFDLTHNDDWQLETVETGGETFTINRDSSWKLTTISIT